VHQIGTAKVWFYIISRGLWVWLLVTNCLNRRILDWCYSMNWIMPFIDSSNDLILWHCILLCWARTVIVKFHIRYLTYELYNYKLLVQCVFLVKPTFFVHHSFVLIFLNHIPCYFRSIHTIPDTQVYHIAACRMLANKNDKKTSQVVKC
jgi:hypothetical protein